MRVFAWLMWLCMFAVLFWVALKNADPVMLRLTSESVVSAPLVIVILAAFVAGMLVGLLTATTRLFKQGREIKRLKGASINDQTRHRVQPDGVSSAPDVPST